MPAWGTDLELSLSQDDSGVSGKRCAGHCTRLSRFRTFRQASAGLDLHLSLSSRVSLAAVEHLALRNITLVVQDWGGTLGLTLPVDPGFRSNLARLFVMNTVLPVGKPLGPHFYLPVGQFIRAVTPQLTDQEMAAYDAPFPDNRFKAGARTFPDLAMVEPGMEGVTEAEAAVRFWKEEWTGQSFMAIGAKDADADATKALHSQIRGCPEPLVVTEADHFVPEWGEPIARAALRSFGDLQ